MVLITDLLNSLLFSFNILDDFCIIRDMECGEFVIDADDYLQEGDLFPTGCIGDCEFHPNCAAVLIHFGHLDVYCVFYIRCTDLEPAIPSSDLLYIKRSGQFITYIIYPE